MKKTLLLIVVLFLTLSCNLKDDCGECFTPPRQFNFDIVDAITGENLFLNETLTAESLRVYDELGAKVEFELVFQRERYIISLNEIGWELESKIYTIELSPDIKVFFELDMDQVSSDCCTYFEVKEFNVLDYEYEELVPTGIIQIKIELN